MLVLSSKDVDQLLDRRLLREAIRGAFVEVSAGRAQMPVRLDLPVKAVDAHLLVMPAYLSGTKALATKLVSVFPRNAGRGLPTIMGVVVLHDSETGSTLAVMDAGAVTALRTAAASAVAADVLARREVPVLAMIGAGVQARAHLRAIADVRHIEEVRVCARRPGSAEAFAKDMAQLAGIRVRAVNSPAEAIRGAGIVVAATTSREPVIEWSWLEPGTHCCAIGFGTRELATDVLANAVVVAVDTREGALAEADDLKRAIEEKRLEPKRIVEVGEVLLEKARGRSSDRDVTVYRSVGMAAMDAAAAALAFRRAQETNAGTPVAI